MKEVSLFMTSQWKKAALLLTLGAALQGCGGGQSDAMCLENQGYVLPSNDPNRVTCPATDYRLTVPATCESGGCGVILDVHGGTMTGAIQDAATKLSQLGKDAVSFGATTPYIVIQPSARGNIWSEGGADDQAIFDFLQSVVNVFNADTSRIHMGGFSQGASMTWRFACKFPETFASFAPTSGTNPTNPGTIPCDVPQHPILYVNGKNDPLAFYANEAPPLLTTVRATIGESNLEETIIQEGRSHTWRRLIGNGYWFEHIAHSSIGLVGGHCMPGGGGAFGCPGSFNYGEAALEFYIEHRKP